MLSLTDEQINKYMKCRSRSGVIYKITNLINGDFYIGSTQNLYKRYYTHIRDIRSNKQSCVKLIRAINKYGESNFKFEIIDECEPNNILKKEQYYLDLLFPKYNIAKIAGSNLGIKRTEECKLLRSIQQKKKWKDEAYREKHLELLSKNWKHGEKHHMAKLTSDLVSKIKIKLKDGFNSKQVSELMKVSYYSVKDIKRGKSWKHVLV